jgi:glycosyltransferase involved in cell wall biosynthesis
MTPRVAFVNGGILGLLSYADWLRATFETDREIHAEHFVLTEDLSLADRAIRRVLCARLWPDLRGMRNADLARFRREYNSGLLARRRLLARGLDHFDVLHFHRQATAYASLDLMTRRPAIVTMDCTQSCALDPPVSDLENWALGFNLRRDGEIFRRAAAIVCASRWAERGIHHLYPECRSPIHVMPGPAPLKVLDAQWIEERRARGSARPVCLFMGGDFARKGGYDLLTAWTQGGFADRATLSLVTDWPLSGPLPPGVRQVTGIRGNTPEWSETWRTADLFVMPTKNEAFGLVYQEAAAAGLPAIGSRLNAIPEIIDEGWTGLLVEPGDTRQLIAALDTLIASADLRETLGRAARRKIENDADPEVHRIRMLELIRQVMKHGR